VGEDRGIDPRPAGAGPRDATQARAYAYALAAVLLWSTVAAAFKLALRWLTPMQLLAIASGVAALALCIILRLQGRGASLLRGTRREWLRSLALGALNPLLY
jgi:uncharacterized membrane protein